MKVVLLATGRLPRSYFTTVRSDLGDHADLVLDVIGWAPPREPLEDTVHRFVLVGPGRIPVRAPEPAPAAPTEPAAPTAPAAPARPAAPPPRAAQPPAWSARRIIGGLRRRAAAALRRAKKSRAWSKARALRTDEISREYWSRIRSREDALSIVGDADIVIALDSRSIRAGWYLTRRPDAPKVVLGIQAAVRERAAGTVGQ